MSHARHAWLLLPLTLLLIDPRPAEAYVDPGSASYLFQILTAALLGGIFLIRTYWNRLVHGIRALVSRDAHRAE